MKKEYIRKIFEIWRDHNPHPKTDLDYTNPFTLMIAVVLSAQATDKGVNKITPALFEKADTPAKMIALGEDDIREHVKSINYYRTKAKNIYALSHVLVSKYNGQVPDTFDDLVSLPGVGRKSANVILNAAFGHPVIGVDTHIFRTANRMGIVSTKTPEETEKALLDCIPDEFLRHAHHWIVLHGRYTCTARAPKCDICPVTKYCAAFGDIQKTAQKG